MSLKELLSWFWNPCKHTQGYSSIKRVWVETEYGSQWKYYKECNFCGKKVRV